MSGLILTHVPKRRIIDHAQFCIRYRAQFEGRDNEMISGFSELDRSTAANDADSLQHGKPGEIAI
jgi:hypothetical protein